MQIQLNTDNHISGRDTLAEHVGAVLRDAVGRHADHITRIEVHLGDVNSHAKTSPDHIRCLLEAHLAGLPPVAVKDQAATVHQALNGAVGKLKRAVDSALGRHMAAQGKGGPSLAEAVIAADEAADR